ncbi:MAG: response regulator transcription factor [Armatimonadota bacterium]
MKEAIKYERPGVTVVVVDNHPIWRAGIRYALNDTRFSIVGEASCRNAASLIEQTFPQLLLLGPTLTESEKPGFTRILKQLSPRVILVVLTDLNNPTFSTDTAIKYLPKSIGCRALVDSLTAMVIGKRLATTRGIRGTTGEISYRSELLEPLTCRELEVLRLMTAGLSNADIGSALSVARSTIKTHVEHIIRKLGVANRVQAVTWAIRQGLASTDNLLD